MNRLLYLILFFICITENISAIDFVKVGSPDNKYFKPGIGKVRYEYEISVYEITNAEYCDFLNNVASQGDPHGLFSPIMSDHFLGGILKVFEKGKFVYRVKSGYENKPVVGVTWNSAVRFINWLHYNTVKIEFGEPFSSFIPQTEGDSVRGAYNTKDLNDLKKAIISCRTRNSGARYWLPNRDEWIKACFFDGNEWNEDWIAKGTNYYDPDKGWCYPYPHIKEVGLGVEKSFWGTYDQQGNVAEWLENVMKPTWRLVCGGSLIRPVSYTFILSYEGDAPDKSINTFGLRVCRSVDKKLRSISPDISKGTIENSQLEDTKEAYDKNSGVYVLCDIPGNVGDRLNQWKGRVNYEFYIGKYELSNAEYTRFLNAVARYSDPYGLYSPNMGNSVCGGIDRTIDKNDHFFYKTKTGWEKRPVCYIGFYDLARYANWLHYGCPNTGRAELGTTEGTSSQGAYDTSDFENVRLGHKPAYQNFGKRNIGALYWIPDENEWYKAAYYDPTRLGNRPYYDYPTRSCNPPRKDEANYMIDNELVVGDPFYVAEVDAYPNAASYFITQQQGGNVWEWLDSWQYNVVGGRGLKGGSWGYTFYGLNACNTDPGGLNDESYVFGGRLCRAFASDGWHPVKTPYYVLLYEYCMMLSPKKLYAIILLIIGGGVGMGGIFLIIGKYIGKNKARIQK